MKQVAHLDAVEEKFAGLKLAALGLQHVLVMYAGAIAVPLMVGGALELPKDQITMLVSADLFCCGIVTLIQSVGFLNVGVRLPIVMGVGFSAVPTIIATGSNPNLGMPGVLGAVMASGLFTFLVAPFFSRWVRFFPPVVTGTVMLIIGLSLTRAGVNWAAGGQPTIAGPNGPIPNPAYATPYALGVAAVVLVSILLMSRFLSGLLAKLAVLFGISLGYAIAIACGKVNFQGIADVSWFTVVTPLRYGVPTFDAWSVAALCAVMTVMMIEATGQILAVGDMAGRRISRKDLARGLRADGVGNIVGALFNTFTYTTYAQNIGLLQITGVLSRWAVASGAAILIVLGCVPKLAFITASTPNYVIGGAAIVMFGMVSATGVKIICRTDFVRNPHNLFIVAVSVGLGMIPIVADHIFDRLPFVDRFFSSGVLVGSVSAVLTNLLFNELAPADSEQDVLIKAAGDLGMTAS